MIRHSWLGASCPREILRIPTIFLPKVQKKRGADVDFQAVWAHLSNQEHQVSPRGASDWWRESVRESVSVHADKIRWSATPDIVSMGPSKLDRHCKWTRERVASRQKYLCSQQESAGAGVMYIIKRDTGCSRSAFVHTSTQMAWPRVFINVHLWRAEARSVQVQHCAYLESQKDPPHVVDTYVDGPASQRNMELISTTNPNRESQEKGVW